MKEDKNLIYKLSDLADSYIERDIETMDDWMSTISEKEFSEFHKICSQTPSNRNEKEDYEISKFALVLYCRELDLVELAITNELITKIIGRFIVNIIVESFRRNGYATTEGPLLLYKDTKITITEKGKKYIEGKNIM